MTDSEKLRMIRAYCEGAAPDFKDFAWGILDLLSDEGPAPEEWRDPAPTDTAAESGACPYWAGDPKAKEWCGECRACIERRTTTKGGPNVR